MEAVDPRSFEVFISYKNSGQDGERTRDAELAFALHDQLQAKGIKSFCSTLSLAKMGQGAYKDAINQALDASKVMVVVGTTVDNILSPWVKYEWGSFHDDLLTGRKQGGTLCSFIAGMNPNSLPRELRGYESFLLEQNGEELIVEFIQAALENKIELGYAGTKPNNGSYQGAGAAAAGGLVNAEDPDPHHGSGAGNHSASTRRRKSPVIAVILAIALVAGGIGGFAFFRHQEQAAAEAARLAEEEAQRQAEEQAQKEQQEWEETHATYTVLYLERDSKKVLKTKLVVEDAEVGQSVTLKAPSIKGYELVGAKTVKLVIAKDDGDNKVIFYYQKPAEPESDPEPSGGNGGSGTSEPDPPNFIIDNI
ncbi:MAG: hypothetical protein ACI36W_05875 [Coriobacteriales bacterium]